LILGLNREKNGYRAPASKSGDAGFIFHFPSRLGFPHIDRFPLGKQQETARDPRSGKDFTLGALAFHAGEDTYELPLVSGPMGIN
jgi:hypothetical protein